jgi:serine/threonine protein kinase
MAVWCRCIAAQARNVLLKSAGGDARGFVAKVSDFGLSMRIDPTETHVSNFYQGTLTHMVRGARACVMVPLSTHAHLHGLHLERVALCLSSRSCALCLVVLCEPHLNCIMLCWPVVLQLFTQAPEVLMYGKVSFASDVYAFGIMLYEMYTSQQAFEGVLKVLLGHEVTKMGRRPEFPPDCPFDYQLLACRCWESDPAIRWVVSSDGTRLLFWHASRLTSGGVLACAGIRCSSLAVHSRSTLRTYLTMLTRPVCCCAPAAGPPSDRSWPRSSRCASVCMRVTWHQGCRKAPPTAHAAAAAAPTHPPPHLRTWDTPGMRAGGSCHHRLLLQQQQHARARVRVLQP